MQLVTFGKVYLENYEFSRPKPLLLLAYLAVEGPQERLKIVDLFWAGEAKDKQAMQKKLGKLSVVLSQLKKGAVGAAIPNKAGINPLPTLVKCDALDFLANLSEDRLKLALELYKAPFLNDLGKPLKSLDLSPQLLDWITEKQEYFADKARAAMIELASLALEQNNLTDVRHWAEQAQKLPATSEPTPAVLAKLRHLLEVSLGDISETTDKTQEYLEELSEEALQAFLALSLQDKPNLTIVRAALKLTLEEMSSIREELILAGLIDVDIQLKAKGLANDWFNRYPKELISLLLKLARSTPVEKTFSLYKRIYDKTQGFGGVGDMPRARQAYALEAKELITKLEFADARELLTQICSVETILGLDPEPEMYFLEAYALERMGHYKEAMGLLENLAEELYNPNIIALKSTLLWRCGKGQKAKQAAETASQSGLDWLWAKATAMNTLGYLAHAEENFLEAPSYFKKAASFYQATSDGNRWVGALNNYAIALDKLAMNEEEKGNDTALEKLREDTEQAYHSALAALDEIEDNPLLRARILLNLGILWERRKNLRQAENCYLEASKVVQTIGAHEIAARLQLNLGYIYFQQERIDEANTCFNQAISIGHKAGEFFIQGAAMANLANMNISPDTMEVALELIEKSGNMDELYTFQKAYEKMLKRRLEQVLLDNNAREAQMLLTKLEGLYQKQDKPMQIVKVQDALGAIENLVDLSQNKTMLMSSLGEPIQVSDNTVKN